MKSPTYGTSPAVIGGGQAEHLMAELRQALADLAVERTAGERLAAEVERLRRAGVE